MVTSDNKHVSCLPEYFEDAPFANEARETNGSGDTLNKREICVKFQIANSNIEEVWNVVGEVELDPDGSDGGMCFGGVCGLCPARGVRRRLR